MAGEITRGWCDGFPTLVWPAAETPGLRELVWEFSKLIQGLAWLACPWQPTAKVLDVGCLERGAGELC